MSENSQAVGNSKKIRKTTDAGRDAEPDEMNRDQKPFFQMRINRSLKG
jgi:hypothetical protein